MAEINTLTINGSTYTIRDPDAARISDAAVGESAWSGKNIVDRLCPGFTESGAVVECEPVEGYPLGVTSRIEPVQAGSGDPSPDNVRPITGRTGVKLQRTGKNLMDLSRVSVDIADCRAWSVTLFKKADVQKMLKPGVTYTMRCTVTGLENPTATLQYGTVGFTLRSDNTELDASVRLVNMATTNLNYVLTTGNTLELVGTFTAPSELLEDANNYYINLYGQRLLLGDGTYTPNRLCFSEIQLECGTAATEYEPYRGEEFSLDLGQTVYGGSMDWTSGVLTVEWKMIPFTSLNWIYKEELLGFRSTAVADLTLPSRWYADLDLMCSHYKTGTANSAVQNDCEMNLTINAYNIRVRDDRFTDGAALAAANEDTMILYKTTQPVTIQLTPQEILALSGTNTLYSDTGDTQVSGKADLTACIEKLTNAIIALGGNI